MIRINKNIEIQESEVKFDFIRSSGPGGQNVNKVSTAVQLRFDIGASAALTGIIKEKLKTLAGRKINKEGVLIIEAKRYRTQEKNRQDSIARFIDLLDKASRKTKHRIKTRPTAGSNLKRIESKKKIGEKKRNRKYTDE
jgi:ribosome-associated protein